MEEDLGSPTVQKILKVWGHDLEWADDSAQDVYDQLIAAGFSPEKIKMLTESAAIREAIEDAFIWLDNQDNQEDEEAGEEKQEEGGEQKA